MPVRSPIRIISDGLGQVTDCRPCEERMERARKSRIRERRNKDKTEQGNSWRLRAGKKQMPTSSHPEADALERPLVTDSELQDYQREQKDSPAIVSINGEDVDRETLKRRRAA